MYPIMKRVGGVSHWLQLPDELSKIQNVFHVSHLCKYIPDPTHMIDLEPWWLREDVTYDKQQIEILDHWEK